MVSKASSWAFPIVAILGLLLFKLSGGIANVLLMVGALLGVHFLASSAVVDLFDFWKYGKRPHWRNIGLKVAGATALLLVALVLPIIRPEPPGDPGRYCRTYLEGSHLVTGCII